MKLNPTPCYNCITLPICRNRLRDAIIKETYSTIGSVYHRSLRYLCSSCPLLNSYFEPNLSSYNIYNRRIAIHYLTGYDTRGKNHGPNTIDRLYKEADMINPYKGLYKLI